MSEDQSSSTQSTASPPPSDADDAGVPEEREGTSASGVSGFLGFIKGMLPFRKNGSLRQDLEVVLEQEDADRTFSPAERAMLRNILRLREVRADDIMIPRIDIDGVEASITLGELLFQLEELRHSRLPVYRETLDDPIGIVHVKDVLGYIISLAEKNPGDKNDDDSPKRNDVVDYDLSVVDLKKTLETADLLRPLLFVPPSMPAADIFAKMQATRAQMALVIDEYGGTDGLISMEDVVEAIVGDIEDEHDDDEAPLIVKESGNRWLADARIPIQDVVETVGLSLDVDVDDDDVATLGGLIFTKLGRVPVRGEVVKAIDDHDLEIVDADPRRIRRVRIVGTKPQPKRRRGRERVGQTQSEQQIPGGELTSQGDNGETAGHKDIP
ncbi:MAG: hemolysin family protein [Pseudomonadota bacterium]